MLFLVGFVDIKSGGLWNGLTKETVQPDMEHLGSNMESGEEEEEESEKSVENLGRLQFKLEYDFQKSEVSECCPQNNTGWYPCCNVQ